MPPMLSDEEEGFDTGADRVTKRSKEPSLDLDDDNFGANESGGKDAANGDAEDNDDAGEGGEDDEDDDEDMDEDEYVVEKILSHIIEDDGTPKFEVKWEGFEKKADRTWEPEENLKDTAAEIFSNYLESIGGREALFEDNKTAMKTKKRGRASAGAASASKRSRKNGDHPADSDAPASLKDLAFRPPAGSWEDHVESVDMCREEDGDLAVYLTWRNGHKTRHPTKQAYQRCPQKILQFYESKINFRAEYVPKLELDADAQAPEAEPLTV